MPSPSRLVFRLLALGLALFGSAAVSANAPVFDATGYDKVTRTILCDCGCHPQSVHDCACARAAEMRAEMQAHIEQGQTGEQVIAAYVAEHGETIRVAPLARGFNLVAWLGPLVGLVGAAVGLLVVVRRWVKPPRAQAPAPAGPAAAPAPADAAYHAQLRREIEDLR